MSMEERVRKIIGDEQGQYESYKCERVIGHGGFSEVRLVTKRNHQYAMKVPLGAVGANGVMADGTMCSSGISDELESFETEALNWARISDRVPDAAVSLVDFNIDPFPWMVMDLAECDLKSAMADGVVTVDDMIDLLGSLQKIHDLGIVHRDIKPENILKVGGRWKFSDFGLSRSLRSISMSGSIAGTPEYMSPEQFLPRRLGPVDARTDIWQMGILAYHIIVGRSPYLSDDPEEKMMVVVSEGPDLDAVPEPYAPVIRRALSFDRSERFQSAREFAEALRDVKGGRPYRAAPKGERAVTEEAVHASELVKDETFDEALALLLGTGTVIDVCSSYSMFESGSDASRLMAAIMKSRGVGTVCDESTAMVMASTIPGGPDSILGTDMVSEWIRGALYERGLGYDKSPEEAVRHYRVSSESGYAPAQDDLGRLYAEGDGVEESDFEAMRYYMMAAYQGLASAQYHVGIMYLRGRGVSASDTEASKWMMLSAEQGYPPAQLRMGRMYLHGEGVQRSIKKGVSFIRSAVEQDYVPAMYELGNLYVKGTGVAESYSKAYEWLSRAAERGLASAQYRLGELYNQGKLKMMKQADALEWFRNAAEQGHVEAQLTLGNTVIPNDKEFATESLKWLRCAAEQGHPEAQFKLGMRYEYGKGVEASKDIALGLYIKAAEQGYPEAQRKVKRLSK